MVMDLDLLYYTIIFLISAILARTIFFSMTQTRKRLPPSPIGLPIIGHLHLLSNFPYRSFHKLSTRYGPLIHLRLGSLPCIVASSPEVVKELLVTNDATFAARPVNIAINNLTYNSSGFSFTPDGPYWKFMKKVSMSQLLGGRTLTQLQPIRRDEICQLVQLLVNKSNACETVNLSEEFMKLSNNTISRMMLGIKCTGADDQTKEIRTLVREVTEIFGQFNLSDFIWFLRNLDLQGLKKRSLDVHRRYDDFLEAIIKEREQSRKDNKKMGDDNGVRDFLDILHNISEDENTEIRVTRDNIKAFMLDFFTAGSDTSASSIEWAFSELINHPIIFNRAREEIDFVVGKSRMVEESDVPHLPYLQAIFKESLRLHPPVPMITRESTKDSNITGYHIPAKTALFVNVWSICRNPTIWKDPLEFQPQRFLVHGDQGNNQTNQMDVRGQHYNLLPFGAGRRLCPGISYALNEVPTVLAVMIQCFDWKTVGLDNKVKHTMIDMTERPGLTVPRAHPLNLLPIARLNPFSTVVD